MTVRPLGPADFASRSRQRDGMLKFFLGGALNRKEWREEALGEYVHAALDGDGEPYWPEKVFTVVDEASRLKGICTGPYPIYCEDDCYRSPGAEGHGLGVEEEFLCGVADCCEALETEGQRREFLVNSTLHGIRRADVLFVWFEGSDEDRSSLIHVGLAKGLGTKMIIVAATSQLHVPQQITQLADSTVISSSPLSALAAAVRICNERASIVRK